MAAAMLVAAPASCAGAPDVGTGESSARVVPGNPTGVAPDLGSGSPAARAALSSCPEKIWPPDGSGEATHLGTYQGVSMFQIAGDPPVIVAVGRIFPEEPAGCTLLRPLEGMAPVAGRFWPLGGLVQAVLLDQEVCYHDFCPDAVLIRDGERPLAALFWPETCSSSMELLSWFTGQDSLRLTCHQSAGAGHREIVSIVHVGTSGLVPVFTLETGTAEAATEEERETPGFCERRPVGWVRLVEKGERPVIKAMDPARGQPGQDGKGTGLVVDLRFDPGTGRFEQIGTGTLQRYDARAWCKK